MATSNAITHTESARMLGVLDDTIENLTIVFFIVVYQK